LFMVCCGLNSVLLLSWLLATPSEPTIWLLLRSFVIGGTSGGALLMGQSLLPDTMEYDYRRTGMRREGAFSGAYSMVEKAGFAVGPLIIGLLLSNAGYGVKSGAPAEGATAFAVYMGVAVIPAVASALAMLVFRGYGLTERTLREMAADAPAPTS
jgi:GPH family glycoside/pentoside/hexuronide:cation symporter